MTGRPLLNLSLVKSKCMSSKFIHIHACMDDKVIEPLVPQVEFNKQN